jgi:chemotaxis protein CheD
MTATAAGRQAVRIGELAVMTGGGVLFTIGLGSCVAVALYDGSSRVAGLAHVMLPAPTDARPGAPLGRFASTAVPALVDAMVGMGATRERLRARIAGGASMFSRVLPDSGRDLGRRNVAAVHAALAAAGVPLDGREVGGEHGRSVFLHCEDGRLVVTSVRHGDVEL